MQHANTSYQQDSVQKEEPRSFRKLRLMVDDIPEQQQNLLTSRKNLEKRKRLSFMDDRAQKTENALANMIRPWKGREKVIDQDARWKKTTIPQNDSLAETQAEAHLARRIAHRVCTKRVIAVVIESAIVVILRIAGMSHTQKLSNEKGLCIRALAE